MPSDGDRPRDNLATGHGSVVAFSRVAARDYPVTVEVRDSVQHQPWSKWNENDVAAAYASLEWPDEHEISVADGWMHALARAGNPELAARAHRVADELRRLGCGELQ